MNQTSQPQGAAAVGVEDVQFLGYRDGVIEHTLELRRDIARAMRRSRPEVLVTMNHHPTWPQGGFNMADHRVVGLASLEAHAAYIEGLGGEFDARAFLESNLAASGRWADHEYAVVFEVIEL